MWAVGALALAASGLATAQPSIPGQGWEPAWVAGAAVAADIKRSCDGVPEKELRKAGLGERLSCEVATAEREARRWMGEIEERDRISRETGRDPKAERSEFAGLARALPEAFPEAAKFKAEGERADAALLIGGIRGTWHIAEKWVPELMARTSGPVYAYEGLDGPGTSPHNERYMEENIQAVADALEGMGKAGARRVIVQTYSMGALVGKGALHELERRGSLGKFERVDLVAIAPTFGGYGAADALRAYLPGLLVESVANPLLKYASLAMTDNMGPKGKVLREISERLPGNVSMSAALGVGDAVSTPYSLETERRSHAVLSGASAVMVALTGHDAASDPEAFRRQGIDPYAGKPAISERAREGLAESRGLAGYAPETVAMAAAGSQAPRVDVGRFRRAAERGDPKVALGEGSGMGL